MVGSLAPFVARRAFLLASLLLAGCQSGASNVPGDSNDHKPWSGIGKDEVVHFLGTEPFWGGHAEGTLLTYTTPENPEGETITVSRFAGRGGLSFSGNLSGGEMTLAITPGECSDGMSDAAYPYGVTLRIGNEVRQGCAWTKGNPRTGGEQG
ncbi:MULTISPECIES: COG3650 family protein [Novosphingobium]|uniref:Lipoprotein n=1 Tax=Novosphingobium mathurense TaxID=428990 RepID=A0A1U6ICE7_9SPHN|nr:MULTISPECIES: hypothetical protein [Novosphingobium]CDO35744.1 conserved exported hypothetical protein [Novosphingobium sp. KN65.2]SLK05686.1 hypothetical protein SAMN06295987_105222 [Novosphingobium mathurense]